jgi:hypothetical protein
MGKYIGMSRHIHECLAKNGDQEIRFELSPCGFDNCSDGRKLAEDRPSPDIDAGRLKSAEPIVASKPFWPVHSDPSN